MHGKGKWAPAIVAAVVLLSVVVAGAVGSSGSDGAGDTTTSSSVTLTVPASTLPQVVTVPTSQPVQKTTLSRTLGPGSSGSEVRQVQERLIELGFDPGEPDGDYGLRTQQAVWAFEKLVLGVPREEVTGQVTNETWSRMQDPIVIRPRRPNSTPQHTEIYLPEQVLIVFHDDVPVLITHISSGDGKEWCEEVTIAPGEYGNENGTEPLKRGECGRSITPGGVFKYNRMREGRRESALGGMYNPVYFNYGIAVHGAHEVPTYPASHGCVRIPMFISDYFQDIVSLGDQVYVWDGVKEPEAYGAQLPVFNWRDPTYTTTTSSTTTTTSTTVPSTTTTKPASTTTTPPPATSTSTTTTSAPPDATEP
jgi:peptidoglycan hydrolase-like protein with peptidoglycan-binding domain